MPKPTGLTPRTLTSLLIWGDHCKQNNDYRWTKWDENRYCMVEEEIKNIRKKRKKKQEDISNFFYFFKRYVIGIK